MCHRTGHRMDAERGRHACLGSGCFLLLLLLPWGSCSARARFASRFPPRYIWSAELMQSLLPRAHTCTHHAKKKSRNLLFTPKRDKCHLAVYHYGRKYKYRLLFILVPKRPLYFRLWWIHGSHTASARVRILLVVY